MVELHGWMAVNECYGDEDKLDTTELEAIMNKLTDIISKQDNGITLRHANGGTYLDVLHCSNHRTDEIDEIIGVFRHAAKAADGSYGLLYLRDDEDTAYCNDFRVYVFKRGQCFEQKDELLSPCIPEIEGGAF